MKNIVEIAWEILINIVGVLFYLCSIIIALVLGLVFLAVFIEGFKKSFGI